MAQVIGGVAVLLIIAVAAVWLIRKSKPENQSNVLPTAAPGWHPGGEKDAATLVSSHLASSNLPYTPYRSTSAAPTQTSGIYSGLPEAQRPGYQVNKVMKCNFDLGFRRAVIIAGIEVTVGPRAPYMSR